MMTQNFKILIIEDEVVLLDVLEKKLIKEGFSVATAADGEEGLKKMKENKPNLIILDIIMPKMDGFEVMKAMNNDPEIKGIPIIIISNSGQPVEVEDACKLGAVDYLVKTQFDPEEVVKKVKDHLIKKDQSESAKEAEGMTTTIHEQDQGGQTGLVIEESVDEGKVVTEDFKGRKILIVEDDRFLRDLMCRKLDNEGMKVFTAIEGQEGLKIAREESPSLILLDIILPGIDGFEVLRQLKGDEKTKSIPVIILSNLGQQQDVDKGISLGAIDFLIKAHFTPNEIIDKISKALAK